MSNDKTVTFTKGIEKTVFRGRSYLKNKLKLTLDMETDPQQKFPYEDSLTKAKPTLVVFHYYGSKNVKKYWCLTDLNFVKGQYKLDNEKRTLTYIIPNYGNWSRRGAGAEAFRGDIGWGEGGVALEVVAKKTPLVIHFTDSGWNKFTKTLNDFKEEIKSSSKRKRKTPTKKKTVKRVRKAPAKKKTTTKKKKAPAKKKTVRRVRKAPAKKKTTRRKR